MNYEYDDLVIYFNGHGSQVKSSDNSSEEDGKDEVLIFKKTPSPNATQEIRIMKDDELTELISKNKCKHILMIFDCCHSNTLIDSDDIPSNVSCLYSCKESEVSYQTDSGLFTKFLFEHSTLSIDDLTSLFDDVHQHPSSVGDRKYLKL